MRRVKYVIATVCFALLLGIPVTAFAQTEMITLETLVEMVQDGRVQRITVRGGEDVLIELRDGATYRYLKQQSDGLIEQLIGMGVTQEQFSRMTYVEAQGVNRLATLAQVVNLFLLGIFVWFVLS